MTAEQPMKDLSTPTRDGGVAAMTDADHLVAAHHAAGERRAAGEPSWVATLHMTDIRTDGEPLGLENRDAIVARVKASSWYRRRLETDRGDELYQIVDELADVLTSEDFVTVMDALYNEADLDRIWIDARR
jgi:hypothetical protein